MFGIAGKYMRPQDEEAKVEAGRSRRSDEEKTYNEHATRNISRKRQSSRVALSSAVLSQ